MPSAGHTMIVIQCKVFQMAFEKFDPPFSTRSTNQSKHVYLYSFQSGNKKIIENSSLPENFLIENNKRRNLITAKILLRLWQIMEQINITWIYHIFDKGNTRWVRKKHYRIKMSGWPWVIFSIFLRHCLSMVSVFV